MQTDMPFDWGDPEAQQIPQLSCVACWHDNVWRDATVVAPQYTGGDEDRPATWVPVCDAHFGDDWYAECPTRLPAFKIERAK